MTASASVPHPLNTATLTITCPDRGGIVAAVSQFLHSHGANIIHSDQHSTDPSGGTFFMRMEFYLDGLDLSRDGFERAFSTVVAWPFDMQWKLAYRAEPKRMAMLVSRYEPVVRVGGAEGNHALGAHSVGMQTTLPSTADIITHLFVRVDDQLGPVPRHPLAKLHISEIVTLGFLFGLKGTGFKGFYRWISRDYRSMFPNLPERSRLSRLITKYAALCADFLGQPSFFTVIDCYPIELIHPRREGRAKHSLAKKSKDKGRWAVGIKWCGVINDFGEIVNFGWQPMNRHDQVFYPLVSALNGQSIVLGDWGFRSAKKATIPENLKLCKKGTWNVRMQVETAFSLVTRIMNLKHMDHRQEAYLTAHLAYVAAVFNILLAWSRELFGWTGDDAFKMHLASFSL